MILLAMTKPENPASERTSEENEETNACGRNEKTCEQRNEIKQANERVKKIFLKYVWYERKNERRHERKGERWPNLRMRERVKTLKTYTCGRNENRKAKY